MRSSLGPFAGIPNRKPLPHFWFGAQPHENTRNPRALDLHAIGRARGAGCFQKGGQSSLIATSAAVPSWIQPHLRSHHFNLFQAPFPAPQSIVDDRGKEHEHRRKGRRQTNIEQRRFRSCACKICIGDTDKEDRAQALQHNKGGLLNAVKVAIERIGSGQEETFH